MVNADLSRRKLLSRASLCNSRMSSKARSNTSATSRSSSESDVEKSPTSSVLMDTSAAPEGARASSDLALFGDGSTSVWPSAANCLYHNGKWCFRLSASCLHTRLLVGHSSTPILRPESRRQWLSTTWRCLSVRNMTWPKRLMFKRSRFSKIRSFSLSWWGVSATWHVIGNRVKKSGLSPLNSRSAGSIKGSIDGLPGFPERSTPTQSSG
mmetsp:Transcript_32239/g.90749  ORF Transcript_32239/g.90749 Transcript_32239/m.90749 type:complete len:210 (-) Transcript_32239:485-1114(-)